jgi:ribose transport system substrate-binding protein
MSGRSSLLAGATRRSGAWAAAGGSVVVHRTSAVTSIQGDSMLQRSIVIGAGLLVLGLAAAGCSSKSADTTSTGGTGGSSEGGKVGVSLPLLTSPFWTAYKDYIPRFASSTSVDLLQPINADGKKDQQLTDINNLLTQGAKGLVISPLDSDAIKPALDKAAAAGAPVVSVDVAPSAGKVFMVVRADNRAYGEKACTFLGDRIKRGVVVQLEGDLGSINGRDRTEAFADCMKKSYPGIKVIGIETGWDGAKAQAGLQAAFTSDPSIKGVYSQAGGVFLEPTLSVLRSKNLLVQPTDPRHVFVVSNDGIKQELDAIRAGYIDATVSQPADSYAQWGLFYIKASLAGKTFTEGPTEHGSKIVRRANGMLEDELPAPLITKENVDDKAFWGNQ